jgi:hypothetical protein
LSKLTAYHLAFQEMSESLFRHGFVIEQILESRAGDEPKKVSPIFMQGRAPTPLFADSGLGKARKVVA